MKKLSVRNIIELAQEFKPCNKITKVSNWAQLAKLLFTLEGYDFCERNKFPSLQQFRYMECNLLDYDIYLDAGDITLTGCRRAALVGDTRAIIHASDKYAIIPIIVLHGAKAITYTENDPLRNETPTEVLKL